MLGVVSQQCCVRLHWTLQQCLLSPVQTEATFLANNSQHCWIGFRLHTLSYDVGSCCAKFETGQTFSYVQTDETTPNNVGSCWSTMLRPFAPDFIVYWTL